MLSIQSLMSSNPYENEPGFEEANEPIDKKNQRDYVAKVRFTVWESFRLSLTSEVADPT